MLYGSELVHFITHIGEDFQEVGLSFIVVLPPPIGFGYDISSRSLRT